MPKTYSTYEAKAKFSEILRKIRGGESVYVTYRGKPWRRSDRGETEESAEAAMSDCGRRAS